MAIIRQDSWTEEDDKLLADTVIDHIRNGSTQLAAFTQAADMLRRTSAACGFRWNAEVRKRYSDEIRQAKITRQANKGNTRKKGQLPLQRQLLSDEDTALGKIEPQINDDADYLDQMLALLYSQKRQAANIQKQVQELEQELKQKEATIEQLRRELVEAQAQPSEFTVTEDYRTLLNIFQRARELGMISGEEKEKQAFRVDASGNIERIG